jgi:hypothetical protein
VEDGLTIVQEWRQEQQPQPQPQPELEPQQQHEPQPSNEDLRAELRDMHRRLRHAEDLLAANRLQAERIQPSDARTVDTDFNTRIRSLEVGPSTAPTGGGFGYPAADNDLIDYSAEEDNLIDL